MISLLHRMQNEAKGKVTQNVLGNNEAQIVKSVFDGLGILSWESFKDLYMGYFTEFLSKFSL